MNCRSREISTLLTADLVKCQTREMSNNINVYLKMLNFSMQDLMNCRSCEISTLLTVDLVKGGSCAMSNYKC